MFPYALRENVTSKSDIIEQGRQLNILHYYFRHEISKLLTYHENATGKGYIKNRATLLCISNHYHKVIPIIKY